MHEPTLTPRGQLRAIIADVARERNLDPVLIAGRCRLPEIVQARAVVVARLFARGLSVQRIMLIMHLSRSTVSLYLSSSRARRPTPDAVADHEDVLS